MRPPGPPDHRVGEGARRGYTLQLHVGPRAVLLPVDRGSATRAQDASQREDGLDIDQQGELAGIHPTQKPVELFVRPIEYHTRRGTSSTSLSLGTQLIAAERTRRCSPQVGSVFRREGDASVRLGSKLPDFLDSDRARHY